MSLESPLHQLALLERGLAWALACVSTARRIAAVHGPNRYTRECVRLASRELNVQTSSCDALLWEGRSRPRGTTQRKAPRLAGTERKENFDVQSVAPAGVPVNGQTPCDAAQRQEERDAR